MSLDARLTFQNIGPYGPLCQELYSVKLSCLLGKYLYELPAYYLALGLRIRHSGKLVKESVGSIHIDQIRLHLITEHLDDLLRLALSEQPMIDMDTDQIVTYGLDQHCRHHGGVDPARKSEQHLLISDLILKGRQLLLDKSICQLGGRDPYHIFRSSVISHFLSLLLSFSVKNNK